MLVMCVAVVLGLLSAGLAAPLTCENLLRPVDEISVDKVVGKWMVIGDTSEVPGSRALGKLLLYNAWAEVTPTSDQNRVTGVQVQNTLGRCHALRFNMTLETNSLRIEEPLQLTNVVLRTECPDCLLFHSRMTVAGQVYQGLMLLSKRRELTTAELESYKKQVECLNLPEALILDPKTDLCPHPDFPADGKQTTDMTALLQGEQGQGFMRFLKYVLNLPGGLAGFMERITPSWLQAFQT